MDSILLKNLRVLTRIGVPDEERQTPQELLVTIELLHPTLEVARSDDVEQGINYDHVAEEVLRLVKGERKTIERLAEDIASVIVKRFRPEGGVRVTVDKKQLPGADFARVTIERP